MDFATPPQASSSAFCIAIQRPIITSMVVSMDSARRGRRSVTSQSAPPRAPHAIAPRSATKKFAPARPSAANAAYAPSV